MASSSIKIFLILLLVLTIFTQHVFIPPVNIDDHQKNNSPKQDASQINVLQLPFIKNLGQVNSDKVKFYAKTFAGTVFVTDDDLTYSSVLKDKNAAKGLAIKEKFVDGTIQPLGVEKSQSVVNYFIGNKDNWKTNVPTFQTLSLGTVWPSVDISLKAYRNNVEKIFTVFPRGEISDIKINLDGIKSLSLANDGRLVVDSELGAMSFTNPIAYQYKDSDKIFVDVSYVLVDSQTYGFDVHNYDPQLPLVIDPLVASTFVGGSDDDFGETLALDSSGNVYIIGYTASSDYPTTSGAYDTSFNSGTYDVFVSKFNNALTSLSASTFIGGNMKDKGFDIALDSSGNVYITGETSSSDYPTTSGAYDTSFNSGAFDVFVSKLNSTLTSLSASTFIGGSDFEEGNHIALDSSGNIYIVGETNSTNYPTTSGAYDTSQNGDNDAFVSKLNSDLTSLSASTFVGGSSNEVEHDIALDSSGNVYITGRTASSDYPTTSGAYDTSQNGDADINLSKLNSGLTSLSASTFVGGSDFDVANAIELDSSGNAYVMGYTSSSDYPTTSGVYDTSYNGGAHDVIVSKLNSGLTSLSASTFVGGSSIDAGIGIALDSSGNVYITGETDSSDYPTTSGAYDTSYNGSTDVFVSKLNSGLTSLSASTFIGGGSGFDIGIGIALDGARNVYITGYTASSDYPTTSGAYDTSFNSGTYDVFVSNIDCNLAGSTVCSTATVSSGGTTTIPVVAGGTATVTAPAGNTVSITLPTGVSGTVTFTDTTANSASTLGFLGSILDITTTATGTKTVSFTFTQDQADNKGITPSQAKIYEDTNHDGSFQTGEALTTTVTGSGPFTATANSDFQSKFAVGGVVSANAVAGAGATLGFLQRYTCDPDGFGSGISLKLYKISYDVASANKLWVEAGTTCGPIKLQIVSYGKISSGGISVNQPKLDKKIILLEAPLSADQKTFSIVLKDKRDDIEKNFRIDKPVYEKDYMKIEQWSSQINSTSIIKPANVTKISADSSIVIPSWIRNNAKWWSNGSLGDTDFVQGMQYLVRNNIVHIPTTKDTSSDISKQIPIWIKSNAGWWADKKISDDEFIKGMQWLISKKIISVT